MHRLLLLLCLTVGICAVEADQLAHFPADSIRSGKVALTLYLANRSGPEATLQVRFEPVGAGAQHLYSMDLPKGGVDGVGRPTLIETTARSLFRLLGSPTADKALMKRDTPLPYFEAGPVLLRVPIQLPRGNGAVVTTELQVTYMSCTETACNRPVTDRVLKIHLPTHPRGYLPGKAGSSSETDDSRSSEQQSDSTAHSAIHWRTVNTVEELEQLIETVHEQERSVLLNFTGPSCAVCQTMKKTVFLDPAVIAGWNSSVPVVIDTDASLDLALWQQQHFHTQARPLYVRIDPDNSSEQWTLVFERDDEESLDQFVTFLHGGAGLDHGTGGDIVSFILLALGGGIFTLLMPCTYPMIPLTVNFFNKQAHGGARVLPLALAYSLGIVLFFTLIGVVIVFVLHSAIATFAGNPWTNLIIAVLFIVLGLSLLDVYFLRLPGWISKYAGSGTGGYFGALVMGCTFALTAFTCTAPFAGAVLAEGVQSGSLLRPVIGMTIYASAIAVPFFVLSMSPNLLKGIPHAGGWMSEIKHVGGMVELAAALKFLVICDFAWSWGLFNRFTVLLLWTLASLIISIYIGGFIRLPGDARVHQAGTWRIIIAVLWLLIAMWFLIGLLGLQNLGVIESFFPGDDVLIL